MNHRVFWIEPTGNERLSLRRHASGDGIQCSANAGASFHRVSVAIGEEVDAGLPGGDVHPHDDPRFPTHCACGYAFTGEDGFYLDRENLYRRADTGETFTLRDAPVGAMWDASWLRGHGNDEPYTGPDGLSLVVRTPGGDWMVDSQASNCTRDQYGAGVIDGREVQRMWLGRSHYCWVRHGDPRTGNVHVDKNGDTCAAGAGSIICGSYHGFLHNGELREC